MHELSIIMNVLRIVEENARHLDAKIVHEIEMEIGQLSGIDFEALEFAMQHTQKNELLETARLVIHKIPARARCKSCDYAFDIEDFYTACPLCGKFNHDIFQGKELKVKAIKVD